MTERPLRLATRGSKLALWQAETVKAMLLARDPGRPVELVLVVSTGDAVRDRPLHQLGGIGVFTKEVQEAVLDGRADLAVHSLKDLPTLPAPGLALAAVPERGPVADALLAPQAKTWEALPQGARVATSSLRRRAQLLRVRPDLDITDIRGNVETRVRKLTELGLDALLLAEAGLTRLGMAEHVTQVLPQHVMLPAVGQGALGLECRADDADTFAALAALEHPPSRRAVDAERAMLAALQGGCQLPIAAHAVADADGVRLVGRVIDRDGRRQLDGTEAGADPLGVGRALAERLLGQGARDLL